MKNFTPPNWLKKVKFLKTIRDSWYYQKRARYFKKLRKLVGPETSIIANACYGGRLSTDLGFPYNSPLVGCYIVYPDYLEFLSNIREYLRAPLQFKKESKYEECRQQRAKTPYWYPEGFLSIGGKEVEIHFLHYHSEEEAREKWERRAARVNFDDLLILGVDQDMATEEDAKRFVKLPFKKKFFFASHNWCPEAKDAGFRFDQAMGWGNKQTVFHKAHTIYRLMTT